MTGSFVPVHSDNPNAATQNKANEQMQAEDEEQLENTPLIPKLDQNDLGTGKEKVLAVPPVPKLRNMDDVNGNGNDEWTNVRMEYRNFSFVKRAAFLIFQVSLHPSSDCYCFYLSFNPFFFSLLYGRACLEVFV